MYTEIENMNETFKEAVKLSVDPLVARKDYAKIEAMFKQAATEFDADDDEAKRVPLRLAGKRGEKARYNAQCIRLKAKRIEMYGGVYN